MSVSPPKDGDVEPATTQSPDEEREEMDRPDRPHAQEQSLPYEFEVKEQDRWLPIANGWYYFSRFPLLSPFFLLFPFRRW